MGVLFWLAVAGLLIGLGTSSWLIGFGVIAFGLAIACMMPG